MVGIVEVIDTVDVSVVVIVPAVVAVVVAVDVTVVSFVVVTGTQPFVVQVLAEGLCLYKIPLYASIFSIRSLREIIPHAGIWSPVITRYLLLLATTKFFCVSPTGNPAASACSIPQPSPQIGCVIAPTFPNIRQLDVGTMARKINSPAKLHQSVIKITGKTICVALLNREGIVTLQIPRQNPAIGRLLVTPQIGPRAAAGDHGTIAGLGLSSLIETNHIRKSEGQNG